MVHRCFKGLDLGTRQPTTVFQEKVVPLSERTTYLYGLLRQSYDARFLNLFRMIAEMVVMMDTQGRFRIAA